MPVFLAVLLTLAFGTMARELPTSCLPSCPSTCNGGELVPDPRNCHQYYTCLEDCVPTDAAFSCPTGYLFDTTTSLCQPDDGSVTIKCEECEPPCTYDCRDTSGVAANRENCTTYYYCGMGNPVLIHCQDGTYFDGVRCVAESSACCDKCDVFCERPYTETADPYSCNHYYYCSQRGFPLPEDHFECPEGETFDMDALKCLEGASCYEPCYYLNE